MVKVTRVRDEHCTGARLIGKKYKNGSGWGEWWQNGWFDILEKTPGLSSLNDNGYIGLMRSGCDGFEYWIGMFFESGTKTPDGFDFFDISATDLAVFHIYGNEQKGEIYGDIPHKICLDMLSEDGISPLPDCLRFERYNCPRYTTPDDTGNVILDLVFAVGNCKTCTVTSDVSEETK